MLIFLDVETSPTRDPDLIAEIRAGIRPPATYKKPESVAQWMESEGERAAQDAVAKTALDAAQGELIAIGVARDDDLPPRVLTRTPDEPEIVLLGQLFGLVTDWIQENAVMDGAGRAVWGSDPHFVAHNAAFDLGWLWRRSIINGLVPPFRIPGPNARPGKDFGCTMMAWAGYRDRIGLKALCRALGLPDPKADGTGAQAWQWWLDGDLERVARYCAGDVEAVRSIWGRLAPMLRGAAA
ncbi:hypothetical protein ACKVEX_05500 [Rhodocyclaceae bacterium SMB388]